MLKKLPSEKFSGGKSKCVSHARTCSSMHRYFVQHVKHLQDDKKFHQIVTVNLEIPSEDNFFVWIISGHLS